MAAGLESGRVTISNSTTSNPMVWDLGFRFRYIFK